MGQSERFCPGCLERIASAEPLCEECDFPRPELGWPVDETIGKVVNRKYRITERLGRGGFGVVMKGRQLHDEHDLGDVVLKFMQSSLTQDLSLRRRFINEAKAARALRSPHVVKVFDFDFDEHGVPFMVMEYLEGQSLSRAIRSSSLTVNRVLRIACQIAGAMDECHAAGIIHRDLKPGNILLRAGREGDFAKIIDFGIARVDNTTVTKTMMGTPRYMAPEQILRQQMDGRTDIFALGVIIHECLCGCPPIEARDDLQYLMLNLERAPTPLRQLAPEAPEELEALLLRMMAKDKEDRPGSMADVQARLRAIETSAPRQLPTSDLEDGDTVPLLGEGRADAETRTADGAGRQRQQRAVSPTRLPQTLASWLLGEELRLPVDQGRRVAVAVAAISALLAVGLVLYFNSGSQVPATTQPASRTGDNAITAAPALPPDAGPGSVSTDRGVTLFVPTKPRRRKPTLIRPIATAPDARIRAAPVKNRRRRAPRKRSISEDSWGKLPDGGI